MVKREGESQEQTKTKQNRTAHEEQGKMPGLIFVGNSSLGWGQGS